jgi:hypothetical protein
MKPTALIFFLLSFATAHAAPSPGGFSPNENVKICAAITNSIESYRISKTNVEKIEAKLVLLDSNSDEYKKWAALLPSLKDLEESSKKSLARYNELEMVTAQILIDSPLLITSSKLINESLGDINLSPVLTVGNKNQIVPPIIQMQVYGVRLCVALQNTQGDMTNALDLIIQDLLTE